MTDVQGYLTMVENRGDLIDMFDQFEREKVVEVFQAYRGFVSDPDVNESVARTNVFLRNFMISRAVANTVDERAGLRRMTLAVRTPSPGPAMNSCPPLL